MNCVPGSGNFWFDPATRYLYQCMPQADYTYSVYAVLNTIIVWHIKP